MESADEDFLILKLNVSMIHYLYNPMELLRNSREVNKVLVLLADKK